MTAVVPAPAFSGPPRKRRLRAPSFSLALPSILWYAFFFILPIVLIVWYSFGVKNTASGTSVPVSMGHKTLQNYRDAFSPTFTGERSPCNPSFANTRFSPSNGTASAMVAMATTFMKESSRRD